MVNLVKLGKSNQLTGFYRMGILVVEGLSVEESTCETRKNVFYFFNSKALFLLENQILQYFRYSNFMTPSNAKA